MSNYFSISGYWKDDRVEFDGYIVKDDNTVVEEEDDQIFFYGLSEKDIQEAIKLGEKTAHDFVITGFERAEI